MSIIREISIAAINLPKRKVGPQKELVDSINLNGLQNPIIVVRKKRSNNTKEFNLKDGFCRILAFQKLGKYSILARVDSD